MAVRHGFGTVILGINEDKHEKEIEKGGREKGRGELKENWLYTFIRLSTGSDFLELASETQRENYSSLRNLDRSIPTSIPEGSGPHNRADAWEFPFSANLEVSTQNSCGISKNHPINLNFGYVTLRWFGALGDLCQLDECG
ncbi:hypothetical protein FB451DRAFT_1193072 [Mycena latifolia]|nr:hypothetical protein FB451DRAFT_1193072 [Mycena latifolia]